MSIHVKDANDFTEQLKNAGDKLVVVDFFATWCGPCKIIAPVLEELATSFAGKAVVLKVDVDECEEVAADNQISSMPTFVFFKDSKEIDRFSGANAENLKQHFEKHTA
ncbi:thioredoxin-2-like [Condylostylus longicornis]|uniref:thioredoxin-2-like n=1 Tax=Condylostylus longicornis TaxID=2530218 RepID=UPI00244E08D5|nr:thioredoxin-2-like [Condylostylus longicornis]